MQPPGTVCRPKCSGFSLVEVVASLLLVGTLLVAVLMAHKRAAQQTLLAGQRLEAVTVLDEFLTLRENPGDTTDDLQQPTGKIPGPNPFYWRTSERHDTSAESLGALIQRVEVYDPQFDSGKSLATVELLMPGKRRLGASYEQP